MEEEKVVFIGRMKAEIVGGSGKSGVHREDESRNCWWKQEKWCSPK